MCHLQTLRRKTIQLPKKTALPRQRVSKDRVFSYIGIDHAGPIYAKHVFGSDFNMYNACKVIVNCSSSRALYLDVVENCSSALCVNILKRFIKQYGAPKQVLSNNGSTFITLHGIIWSYKIAGAPSTSGFCEHIVHSVKQC